MGEREVEVVTGGDADVVQVTAVLEQGGGGGHERERDARGLEGTQSARSGEVVGQRIVCSLMLFEGCHAAAAATAAAQGAAPPSPPPFVQKEMGDILKVPN